MREVRPPSWDLPTILNYLRSYSFEPLSSHFFFFRDLTRKTLFLLSLATARRVGELQALSCRVSFSSSAGLSYVPEFVAKTESGVRPLPRSFEVKSLGDFAAGLPEDLLLCPVRSLSTYLDRTSGIVNRPRRLFVSSRCPFRAVSKNGISYLLWEVIVQSGATSQSGQVLERIALEALLSHLPFSVTGLFGAFWRRPLGVRTQFLHLFICGIYLFIQMEFTLWVLSLLLVNALVNSHRFVTSGGGGGVRSCLLGVFSSVTHLTILVSLTFLFLLLFYYDYL